MGTISRDMASEGLGWGQESAFWPSCPRWQWCNGWSPHSEPFWLPLVAERDWLPWALPKFLPNLLPKFLRLWTEKLGEGGDLTYLPMTTWFFLSQNNLLRDAFFFFCACLYVFVCHTKHVGKVWQMAFRGEIESLLKPRAKGTSLSNEGKGELEAKVTERIGFDLHTFQEHFLL